MGRSAAVCFEIQKALGAGMKPGDIAVLTLANSPESDTFQVRLDGAEIYYTDASIDLRCDLVGYDLVSLDVSAWADGSNHMLRFEGHTNGASPPGSDITNFMVDDVALLVCQ